jgi:dipeptidyl aminopeptidase/acylaminoacyl peptidase
MKRIITLFCLVLAYIITNAQTSPLSIEKIMKGEYFTGFSPEDLQWSPEGKSLYFTWNPEMAPVRSYYVSHPGNPAPRKATPEEKKNLPTGNYSISHDRTKAVYSREGDLYLMDLRTGIISSLTSTGTFENSPEFSSKDDVIFYTSANNLYSLNIGSGKIIQKTDIRSGKEKIEDKLSSRDEWLRQDQLNMFRTLEERKEIREIENKEDDELRPERPRTVYMGNQVSTGFRMSPDEHFITWMCLQPADDKRTIIPSYVTESGYTEDINSRPKVGMSQYSSITLFIYDLKRDSVYRVASDDIPGINDKPSFLSSYPERIDSKNEKRSVSFTDFAWSGDGRYLVTDIYSDDHKDRWIMLVDPGTGKLRLLDRQHDDAWIGGPGIRSRGSIGWLPDNKTIYFQSEETGFSHLYTLDVSTGAKKAITSGNYEIYNLHLSNDGKVWYFTSNEKNPGINELYKVSVKDGLKTLLTHFDAGVEYTISPAENYFALRVSFSNKPWELYLLENKEKAVPVKVTESTTEEFRTYNWKIPEFVSIKASDGTMVPARLYRPANPQKNGPAVIFVHGSGYLQNVHKWWSHYFREYMFHNFLVDNGYTVLDIDYRGSAGYGRDWRTAIYRYMGGRDLDDHVDAAAYLSNELGVDPARIGIYGGSYGGFITLMAMFTKPGVFSAGAALRPVTDWAHYNHGYTSNILNTPVLDSMAYVKSSPIYHAEGLKGSLLICHGMIDDNVHFQDVVRLTQRLIELGKDNWELAVFPLESHGFVEASSWTDEYRRIFKLFEENLK